MKIIGYTYKSDIYCMDCLVNALDVYSFQSLYPEGVYETEDFLDKLAEFKGIDRYDESSFDSGDFPKVIFSLGDPEFCGPCGEEL